MFTAIVVPYTYIITISTRIREKIYNFFIFYSSKFSRKLFFVYSLKELYKTVPLEQEFIPERVKKRVTLKITFEKLYSNYEIF